MRPISTLTEADLRLHPVWRYQTRPAHESDEPESCIVLNGEHLCEEVEPVDRSGIMDGTDETLIALTIFRDARGQEFVGFCAPADGHDLAYSQPQIITPEGHVRLWWDWNPGPEVLSRSLSRLGGEPVEVFPIWFRCLVPADGEYLEDVVELKWVIGFE